MNLPTNHQLIESDGKPVAVVVPYKDYIDKFTGNEEQTIPHAVISLIAEKDYKPAKAWRKYRGYSQKYMAEKLAITQSAYSQLESREFDVMRADTRARLLSILDVTAEQML